MGTSAVRVIFETGLSQWEDITGLTREQLLEAIAHRSMMKLSLEVAKLLETNPEVAGRAGRSPAELGMMRMQYEKDAILSAHQALADTKEEKSDTDADGDDEAGG
jgi:hypothetical protein